MTDWGTMRGTTAAAAVVFTALGPNISPVLFGPEVAAPITTPAKITGYNLAGTQPPDPVLPRVQWIPRGDWGKGKAPG